MRIPVLGLQRPQPLGVPQLALQFSVSGSARQQPAWLTSRLRPAACRLGRQEGGRVVEEGADTVGDKRVPSA